MVGTEGDLTKRGLFSPDSSKSGIAEFREQIAGSRPIFDVVSRKLSDGRHFEPLVNAIATAVKSEGGRHLLFVRPHPDVVNFTSTAEEVVKGKSYIGGVDLIRAVSQPYEEIVDRLGRDRVKQPWRAFLMDWRDAYDNMAIAGGRDSGHTRNHFLSFGARGNALLQQMGLTMLGIDAEIVEPRKVVAFDDSEGFDAINEKDTKSELGLALRSKDSAQVLLLPAQTGDMTRTIGGEKRTGPGFLSRGEPDAVIADQAVRMARFVNPAEINFWVPYGTTDYKLYRGFLNTQLGETTNTRVNFAFPNTSFPDKQEFKFRG